MIEAVGMRIGWVDLPAEVQAAIQRILGSPVVEARSQPGGFSPGTADRVLTADGTRAFVKAVSPDQNEISPGMHRREAEVAAALPSDAPAPRLLGTFDDGHWVALVLADVDGRHPSTPWRSDELHRVIDTLARLASTTTSVPLPGLEPLTEKLAGSFAGWANLRDDPPDGLNPWAAEHLEQLRAGADRGLAVLTGDTLVHLDVRADNLLLAPGDSGAVTIVDWPHAARGPAWFDTLLLLINVRLYSAPVGGAYGAGASGIAAPDTGALLDELAASSGADRDDLIAVLVGWAGFFTDMARRPPPKGLPTLREFQRAQAEVLLVWLAELGLPPTR